MSATRIRDVVTTLFEVAGLLVLAVAAGVFVSAWSLAGGLAASGVLLIGASALVVQPWARKGARR